MRVSFLVPAYNEAATIEALLDAVWALELEKQIVVVDDGSTDETGGSAERWRDGRDGVVLISQQNRGKGAACLLYTSPSPRDRQKSRMPSSA